MTIKGLRILVASLLLVGHSQAADFVWTNTAGGNWGTAANWSPNQVPGGADNAYLTNTGNYSVTVNVNATVASLQAGGSSGAQTLTLSGSTLTLNGTSLLNPNSTFVFASGTLTGSGDVTVAGTLNWSSGTMSGSGRTIIASGATLNLNNTTHDLNRVLQNDGVATWTAGALQMNGGTFTNNGSFTVNNAATLQSYGTGGGNVFNNAGTFTKQGAGTVNFTVSSTGVSFNNNGVVDVQGGTLALNAGGSNSSSILVAAGASFGLSGSLSHAATSAISGPGTVNVAGGSHAFAVGAQVNAGLLNVSSATVNFGGDLSLANMDFVSGTLTGSGDVTVAGTLNWSSGTMSGSGRTIIASGGTLSLNNTTHDLNRVLQNDGVATWTAGALQMNGGTFTNNGSFTVNSAATLQSYGTGGVNVFNNAGTFTKQGAGTVNFTVSSTGVSFNNNGVVDVQGGTLALNAGGSNSSSILVAAGASFGLSGSLSHAATSAISGPGTVNVAGGSHAFAVGAQVNAGLLNVSSATVNFGGDLSLANMDFVSGTLTGSGDVTVAGTLNWSSGTMSGSGRTIIASGGTLSLNNTTHDLNRVLQNDGVATWTAGALQMNGGTFTNNGSFTVNNAATLQSYGTGGVNVFNNAGTFTKQGAGTVNFTVSSTGVSFNNNGVVDVQGGTLALIAGGTHSNDFAVAGGATLGLNGTHNFSAAVAITGTGNLNVAGGTITDAGTVNVGGSTFSSGTATFNNAFIGGSSLTVSGGTVNFNGTTSFAVGATMNLSSGTMGGTGDVTVTGALNWSGGTMSGSGRTIIASGATLNLNNTTHDLNRVLQNDGTATWTAGALQMNGGTFTNKGSFTVNNAATLQSYGTGGVNVFNNAGTFTKQGAGTVNFTVSSTGVSFNNNGVVDVQAGTLTFNSGFTQTGGQMILSGGTVSANSAMQIQGGVLRGVGTVSASVNNSGTISPGASPGLLTITGNYTQGTNGVLNVELAGTVPGSSFDLIAIGGAATLAGTLNVTFTNSFQPATNSSFTFLTANSRSGSFGTFNYPSNIVGLQVTYSGTSATIQEATVPFTPTVYWVGGSGSWNTESNWSTGTLPGVNDDVLINVAGDVTVTHSSLAHSVRSLYSQNAVVLSGGTLTVSNTLQVNNGLTLIGGTLRGATVLPGSGGQGIIATSSGGTLDGVTVNGSLDVGRQNNGAVLTVLNGLVLNGTLYLGNATNSWSGQVGFVGTQTLGGNGTVVLGNQGACNALRVDTAGTTLTLGSGITVRGHSGQIGQSTSCIGSPANVNVINQGTIAADVSGGTIFTRGQSFVNAGVLNSANGGHLSVQNMTGNVGVVSLIAGSTLTLNGTYTNNLALNLTTNAVLNLSGSWANTGGINATNATVNLGGNFTLAGLGVINRSGGAVNLTGTLDAAGGTLTFDSGTGSWLMNGGTLRNGVLSQSGGAQLIIDTGTLDGVTVNGSLDVGRQNNGAVLTVLNGLVLNGTLYLGNATNSWSGQVGFVGTQTLGGNGTVVLGNQGACNALRVDTAGTTLTLGSGITVRGHSGQIGQSTSCIGSPANVNVINQGTIAADVSGGTIFTRGQSFVNAGVLNSANGGHLSVQNMTGNVGVVSLIAGSTLTLNGTYTNNLALNLTTNAVLNLSGSWANTGGINATNATVNLGGSSIQMGTVVLPGCTLNLIGSFIAAQVGNIQYSAGAVRVGLGGVVDNTGNTLLLDAGTGSWLMNGGTLRNGVLSQSGGAQLIIDTGTLDGVTVNGGLDVGRQNNGASLTVLNGLVLNGTLYLGNPTNGWYGQVGFTETQTLGGSGTVIFGNQGACNALRLNTAGTTLTLGSGITVRGHSGQIGQSTSCFSSPANVSVVNQGTIAADVAGGTINLRAQSFTNQAMVQILSAAALLIDTLQNSASGTVLATNGTLTLNGNWNNAGVIVATNATVNLGGSSTLIGNFLVPGSVLNIAGNFTASQIQSIQYSAGAVRLNNGSVVDNTGNILLLDAGTGSWLMNGGTLRNGVLNQSGGAQLIIDTGTLDGVTVNGGLDVGRQNNGASLTVLNGLVLNGTLYLGNPTNGWYGQVGFTETQTLGGSGTVVFGNQGACNALRLNTAGTTLTLGSGITVRGHSGQIGQSTSCFSSPANVNVINQGTIAVDVAGGTINLRAQSFTNQGSVDAQKGTISLSGAYSLAGGTLSLGITSLTDYGHIDFINPLTMQGTLKAQFAGFYRPTSGSSFTLLTYPSRTGNFGAFDLPTDMQWQTTNGATAFAITATALLELPSVAIGPQTQSLVVGSNATLNVAVLGTQPLAYQWRLNGTNLTDGGRIAGSQSNSLNIANIRFSDAGGYRVVVTNAYGAITSSVATLTPLCIIAASNYPALAGTVAGTGVFAANTTNLVTANPSGGYKFAYWTEGANILSTNRSLATVLQTNHFYVAIYQEANPLHVVTTATSPTNLAALTGAGTYSNGQSFAFSAPVNVTNPPNLYTFREWLANGAFVTGSASFNKTFSTLDPTNLQFVAHYDMASILPLVTNVTVNLAQPIPATTNLQLSFQFNRTMNTSFTPLVVLTNLAVGSVQPVVTTGGTWSGVAAPNDTFTPPPITLATGMDGTNQVVVSLARDVGGGQLTLTNVLALRVDVTPPPNPVLSVTASNSSSATVGWSGYAAPADLNGFRIFLASSNFTSVAGRSPVSAVGAATRQFTFSGLALDQPYFAAVTAVDAAGNSTPAVTPEGFSLPSSTPPPVLVQIQTVGPASALVSWNSYSTTALFGFAGFRLYYETNNFTSVSNLTARQTLSPSIRSVQIDDLNRTRTYYFAVVGFNGNNAFNSNATTAAWSDPLAGNIGLNLTVGGPGQTVDILQSITIVSNAVLTVPANTTLRFAPGTGLIVQQGALHADGTALDPVVFTSANDQPGLTPAAGDWAGVKLGSGAGASLLRHIFIKYGADLTISNCAPTVEAFTALYNAGAGLNLLGTATLTTSDALLAFNDLGVRQLNSAQLNIRNSVIKNNGTNAHAAGSASLIATQNWWGSAVAGEVDATVQGVVVRSNFFVSEPLLTPAIGTSNNVTQTGSRDANLRLACRTAEAMRLSEDSTFAGVFFTPFTNAAGFQLSEGGGVKTVFAQFRSLTGQTSAPVNVALTYVTTGPTIGTFSLTEGQVLNRPLLVTGTASAPLGMAVIEFYVDNIGQATNAGGGFSFSFDVRNFNAGVHRVKLLARDTAGNFATLERNVVITPVPPPAPAITDPPVNLAVNTNTLRIAGTAEPLVEVRLFRSGTILGTTNASAAGTFSFANVPLIEGANAFTALAIDALGSASSPVRNVTLDTIPPAPLLLDPASYYPGQGLTLTWRFPTTGKHAIMFRVFWSPTTITNVSQAVGTTLFLPAMSTTLQGMAPGNYYFYVVGYDALGNPSPLSAPVQFFYDGLPPAFTVTFDKPAPVGVGPLRVTLASSEPVNGVPSTTVQLNGNAPVLLTLTNIAVNTFAGTMNVTPFLPSGPVVLNVSAQDTAGNPFNGPPSGPALSIDVKPPSGAISTAPGSPVQATNDTVVAVNLQLTEAPKLGTVPTLNFGPPVGTNVPVILSGSGTNWNGTLPVTPAMDSGIGYFTLTVNDALDNVGHSLTSGSTLEIYNTALPTPPGQPVGFQVASLFGGRVQLNWLAVSNAEVYRIYSAAGTNLIAPTNLVADNVISNNYIDLPPVDGFQRYVVSALRRGAEGLNSIVRVALSDRTPPLPPTAVTAQLVATGVQISWLAGSGETPNRYHVYRNGTLVRTATGATPVIDVPPRGVMNYTVAAVDALGNEALSAAASIELLVGAVNNLLVLANDGQPPALSWTSEDATAVGFNVYRNGTKQNVSPLPGPNFIDTLTAPSSGVQYTVRAVNDAGQESAPRSVDVYQVALQLLANPAGSAGSNPLVTRYFDQFEVTVSNVTAAGSLPLRQLELHRTLGGAAPSTMVQLVNQSLAAGNRTVQSMVLPCATVVAGQAIRLRAVQETDLGGSSVIYQRLFDFNDYASLGVMIQVTANQLPLAGGLAAFELEIFNRGYADMNVIVSRNNGADPGDIYLSVKDAQGQEVSRGDFNGTPVGTTFLPSGVGYITVAPGASRRVTVSNVLVPETLAANASVTFEGAVSRIYHQIGTAGQIESGPLSGSMNSALAVTDYYGTAQTDKPGYANEEPVIITGQAIQRSTGLPLPNTNLKIGFATRGFQWYREVTTDNSGNYQYIFNPAPGLGGFFKIWAAHPLVFDILNQAEIAVYRLYASPPRGDIRMSKNDSLGFSISLINPGDSVLTSFTVGFRAYTFVGTNQVPETRLNGSVVIPSGFSIGPRESRTINLLINADADAPDNAAVEFTLQSAEGAAAVFTGATTLLPAVPVLTVIDPTVGYLETSLDRGDILSRSVTVMNRGLKDLKGVELITPTNVTWMIPNLPLAPDGRIRLPDIGVGQSNTFTIVFTPPTNTPLAFYQDQIVIKGTNSPAAFTVNLYALVTSDQKGAVQFYVENILGQPVPNATVRMRSQVLQAELVPVLTDANGLVTINDLQEGQWSWMASAPGHSSKVGTVEVVPNQTVQVAPPESRLSKSLVTVNFRVEPVPYTDRYEIKIEQTFETHVPIPVLVVDPVYKQFNNVQPGFEANYIVTVKNHGLLEMTDVTLTGGDPGWGTLTPLITYIPVLLPQQSVEIPFRATYSGILPGPQGKQAQQFDPDGFADCASGGMAGLADAMAGIQAIANAQGRCISDQSAVHMAQGILAAYTLYQAAGLVNPVAFVGNLLSCLGQQLFPAFGGGSSQGTSTGAYGPATQNGAGTYTTGGPECFVAGTQVLVANGEHKAIELIRTNDVVRTGTRSDNLAVVTEVHSRLTDKVRAIRLVSRDPDAATTVMQTTDEHLFWVDGKGWTVARDLTPADWLSTESGGRVRIAANDRLPQTLRVYTFKLREDSAFYANGVLVHDMCGVWQEEPSRLTAEAKR